MKEAFVLMTAMPPTKGHLRLIQFAAGLGAEKVRVILCTQPGEPFSEERHNALYQATRSLPNVFIHRIHQTLPQEPEGNPGFWEMWASFLNSYGFMGGDYIVTSEMYGKRLAEEVSGVWVPFDVDRELYPAKATKVRGDYFSYWEWILPEFRPFLQTRITFFGAESTGKTTLSKWLARDYNGEWGFEWARPYLEKVENVITDESMTMIWKGQLALQRQLGMLLDKPFIVQDTDLFSTVGYWENWKPGETPQELVMDAMRNKSDLYIIPGSEGVPFEPDPLRYGGDHRETSDQYWIDLAEQYGLNYRVLGTRDDLYEGTRNEEVMMDFWDFRKEQTARLTYERVGNH